MASLFSGQKASSFGSPQSSEKIFINGARQKIYNAKRLVGNIEGRRETLTRKQTQIIKDVGLAKGRLLLKPQVDAFLESLQMEAHQKAVGAFENLLTALANDVLKSGDRIGLDLYTDRGLPALDIFIDAGDGKREDIIEGCGGSMTNVVSFGLRMIATMKSGLRRFVALDEPDCWIAPERVPKFYNVVQNMGQRLDLQCLVISHHDVANMDNNFSIVKLKKSGDSIQVDIEKFNEEWSEDKSGIRSIRMLNFMSHKDTTIPLSPKTTAVVGDNHIGKSVVMRALRALAYGEVDDSDIRHGEKKLEVIVEIENDLIVRLTRQKGRNPVNEWTLEQKDGSLVVDTKNNLEYKTGGRQVPAWVLDYLKIGRLEGLDIQLSHQKFPIFLLGESAAKRASVLSIGRESGYIQNMIAKNKENSQRDTSLVKSGEKELGEIQEVLATFENLDELSTSLNILETALERIGENVAEIEDIKMKVETLQKLSNEIERTQVMTEILSKTPDNAPDLDRELDELSYMLSVGRKMKECEDTLNECNVWHNILSDLDTKEPLLEDTTGIKIHLSQMTKAHEAISAYVKKEHELDNMIAESEQKLEKITQEMGGLCPTCHQTMNLAHVLNKEH